jgi:hypothetical protein
VWQVTAARLGRWLGRPLLVCVLALTATTAGCGGVGKTPLVKALDGVGDAPSSRTSFVYEDTAALRTLAGLAAPTVSELARTRASGWSNAIGVGSEGLGIRPGFGAATGIDPLAADLAVAIGAPPDVAVRVSGAPLRGDTVEQRLMALGASRTTTAGHDLLAFGAERSVHLDDAVGRLGVVSRLDRVLVEAHSVAAGSSSAPVLAVAGGGTSLGRDDGYRAAAACLGDVVVATIVPGRAAGVRDIGLVAMGVRRPPKPTTAPTLVLCLVDPSNPTAVQAGLRKGMGPGALVASTRQPLATLLTLDDVDSATEHGRRTVRATARSRSGRSFLLFQQMLARADLPGLWGEAAQAIR